MFLMLLLRAVCRPLLLHFRKKCIWLVKDTMGALEAFQYVHRDLEADMGLPVGTISDKEEIRILRHMFQWVLEDRIHGMQYIYGCYSDAEEPESGLPAYFTFAADCYTGRGPRSLRSLATQVTDALNAYGEAAGPSDETREWSGEELAAFNAYPERRNHDPFYTSNDYYFAITRKYPVGPYRT